MTASASALLTSLSPRFLLNGLALGARHRVAFPRELMLLTRALVTFEATAMIVDPQLNLAELVRTCTGIVSST